MDADEGEEIVVPTADEGGDDEAAEQVQRDISLYRVCDETGSVQITQVRGTLMVTCTVGSTRTRPTIQIAVS